MVDCFSNSAIWCKGRPVASALEKRWQGWPAGSALGKHGDTDGQWFQHWKNVLVENARKFSTGETRWKGRPSHSAMGEHGGGYGQLLQRWWSMMVVTRQYFCTGET